VSGISNILKRFMTSLLENFVTQREQRRAAAADDSMNEP
jgi:hypothetical protein